MIAGIRMGMVNPVLTAAGASKPPALGRIPQLAHNLGITLVPQQEFPSLKKGLAPLLNQAWASPLDQVHRTTLNVLPNDASNVPPEGIRAIENALDALYLLQITKASRPRPKRHSRPPGVWQVTNGQKPAAPGAITQIQESIRNLQQKSGVKNIPFDQLNEIQLNLERTLAQSPELGTNKLGKNDDRLRQDLIELLSSNESLHDLDAILGRMQSNLTQAGLSEEDLPEVTRNFFDDINKSLRELAK